jgi:hypothetical protein
LAVKVSLRGNGGWLQDNRCAEANGQSLCIILVSQRGCAC